MTFKVAVLAFVMFLGFALSAPLMGGDQRPTPEQASAVRALLVRQAPLLPAGMLPGIFVAGAITAGLWLPLAASCSGG